MRIAINLALILAAVGVSPFGVAQDAYICRFGDSIREIHVVYDTPGQALPCSVLYRKAEGEQTLWTAQNMPGFCEAQAREFMEKQQSWGWTCTTENTTSDQGLSDEEMSAEPVEGEDPSASNM